jgi:hypothetical protein
MMKRFLATGILALATACAGAPETQPAQQVQAVGIEMWVWGVEANSWVVSRVGPITHKTVDTVGPAPVTYKTTTKTFAISSQDFEALLAILKPARERLEAGVPCDKPLVTDQPYVKINWAQRGSDYTLGVNYACVSPAMASVQQSYDKATAFLRDLEAAAR